MGTLANSEDPDKSHTRWHFIKTKNMYVFNNLPGHLKHTIKCKIFDL